MYMLPDLAVDYPVGMGGLDLDETHLRRYLGRHLIILLGDADTDSAARTSLAARRPWLRDHTASHAVSGTSSIARRSPVGLVRSWNGSWKLFQKLDTSVSKSSTEPSISLRTEFHGRAKGLVVAHAKPAKAPHTSRLAKIRRWHTRCHFARSVGGRRRTQRSIEMGHSGLALLHPAIVYIRGGLCQ